MKLHYGFDELKDIDFMAFLPILLPVIAIGLLLALTAFVDLYRHRKTRRNMLMWMLIILFMSPLGPILYFVVGRKENQKF